MYDITPQMPNVDGLPLLGGIFIGIICFFLMYMFYEMWKKD